MRRRRDVQLGVDANGCPTETVTSRGRTTVIHYDDIPDEDVTEVHGLRCTTAVRTVIDLAVEVSPDDLATMLGDCLGRGLFTVEEMRIRLGKADMAERRGAALVGACLDARFRGA